MLLELRFVVPVVGYQELARFVHAGNRGTIKRHRGFAGNVQSFPACFEQLPGGIFRAIVKSNQVEIVKWGNISQPRGEGVESVAAITVSDGTGSAQQR